MSDPLAACPTCRRVTLDWDPRCSSWLCKNPDCTHSESERERTRRLTTADAPAQPAASVAVPVAHTGALYCRCPVCRGSLQVPGATMNSLPCVCTAGKTPGYLELTVTLAEFDRARLDRDRLLVALWDVAMVDDGSESSYLAASHVHARSTSVYKARQNLKLPLTPPDEMVLPDHEGRKAAREAGADPDAPPVDKDALLDERRHEVLALREQLAEAAGNGPGGGSSPLAYPLFGELDTGETFVVPPLDSDGRVMGDQWVPRLMMKIAAVKRSDPTMPDLVAQDHESGVMTDVPPGARVIRVRMGVWGKRKLL